MRSKLFSLLSFGCFSIFLSGFTFNNVEYLRNYDADTISVNIPDIHPLLGKNIRIRLIEIDAPEIKTKDPCEKELSILARDFVTNVLTNAVQIDLTEVRRGNYFRLLANVIVDGNSLTDMLIEKNYVVPYKPGQKINWCDVLNQARVREKEKNGE